MGHILIVDDDRDILRLMQFTLQKAGHSIDVAVSGAAGVTAVQKKRPDLIIADIMMPEMTGYEFTRQVRSMPRMDTVPIIIYSARFQSVDQKAALDAGATDYMPKTLAPGDIVQRVNRFLGATTATPQQQGITVAFFSLKGGTGVSTLAVNVALAIALSRKTQVSLTDLNPFAGHAGLMLNLRSTKHLFELLCADYPPSLETVKASLTSHPTGIQLLASPLMPETTPIQQEIKPVLYHLKSLYPFNFIDMPHILMPEVSTLLADITRLVLVITPNVPCLQSAVVAMQILTQAGLPPERIFPVLNYITESPGLSPDSIQKTLRHPLAAIIPFDGGMLAAINSSKPLILSNPQSATTTAIARLAVMLSKQTA